MEEHEWESHGRGMLHKQFMSVHDVSSIADLCMLAGCLHCGVVNMSATLQALAR